MAAQDWSFASVDDEWNQLNGGPWAGLNGFVNADDLGGEHWSSDTWNEPYPDHAAAPSSAQRPTDHTSSHAPALLSSPPRPVSNELLRFDPLADAPNYHDPFRQQPREPLHAVPSDTNYRRPSRDLPSQRPYQLADNNPVAPLPPSVPEREAPIYTPQQQAHDTDYQAVETDSDDDAILPRGRRAVPVTDGSPVDLTQSPNMAPASASQQSRTRKRSSTSTGGDSGSAKKRTKRTSMSTATVDLEDLEDEAPSADAELLQAQQREALKMQETNKEEGPVKIGQRTCIICLENYTNATTATCGHIFCHECLTRALMASEKNSDRGKGNCPACRKAINRRNAKEVIPISFLKKSAFSTKGRQAHNR